MHAINSIIQCIVQKTVESKTVNLTLHKMKNVVCIK